MPDIHVGGHPDVASRWFYWRKLFIWGIRPAQGLFEQILSPGTQVQKLGFPCLTNIKDAVKEWFDTRVLKSVDPIVDKSYIVSGGFMCFCLPRGIASAPGCG